MMFPIINIGPLAIQSSGFIIILGIWFGISSIEKNYHKFILSQKNFMTDIYWALFSIPIFSRISYIIQYMNDFLDHPKSIFSPNLSLFDPLSGVILSAILLLILLKKDKISIESSINAMTSGISLFLIFYFTSLLANGEYYGISTTVPWGIILWGVPRHPLQIYYAIAFMGIYFWIRNSLRTNLINDLFAKFIVAISIMFIFLDFFRGDNQNIVGGIHIIQVLGLIALIISLLKLNLKQKINSADYAE
ncbi:MAG: prolipoprotein diacylglyceryl transferase family protein [Anaerolineaceae bacterium]